MKLTFTSLSLLSLFSNKYWVREVEKQRERERVEKERSVNKPEEGEAPYLEASRWTRVYFYKSRKNERRWERIRVFRRARKKGTKHQGWLLWNENSFFQKRVGRRVSLLVVACFVSTAAASRQQDRKTARQKQSGSTFRRRPRLNFSTLISSDAFPLERMKETSCLCMFFDVGHLAAAAAPTYNTDNESEGKYMKASALSSCRRRNSLIG